MMFKHEKQIQKKKEEVVDKFGNKDLESKTNKMQEEFDNLMDELHKKR